MSNNAESKERSFFAKFCSILTDILVYPVLIIAFACAIFMSSAKANNQVPSIFGNSIVQILTNSMDLGTEQSYKVGDVLIINQNINLNEIDVGDCIAFYAPKQSGYVDDNGNSLVIFHRVVRIVYVKDANDVSKRYFVCHGDNAGALTYVQAQNVEESDYNAEGNLEQGGGYVVKLVDDTDPASNQDHTLPSSQSQLQYVADEFVVGELKSRANGFLAGLVKFCCSTAGITVLVIVPSAIMLAMVVLNMVRESKNAKKERDEESLVFAQTMSMAGGADIPLASDKTAKPEVASVKEEAPKQAEQVKAEKVAQVPPKTAPSKPATTASAPAKPAEDAKTPVKPTAKAPTKPEAKTAPIKPTATTPTKPATATKTTATKAVPNKAETPVAPKPTPAKTAPKATPATKTAPAKPEAKVAPTKTPPAKTPPKKD